MTTAEAVTPCSVAHWTLGHQLKGHMPKPRWTAKQPDDSRTMHGRVHDVKSIAGGITHGDACTRMSARHGA